MSCGTRFLTQYLFHDQRLILIGRVVQDTLSWIDENRLDVWPSAPKIQKQMHLTIDIIVQYSSHTIPTVISFDGTIFFAAATRSICGFHNFGHNYLFVTSKRITQHSTRAPSLHYYYTSYHHVVSLIARRCMLAIACGEALTAKPRTAEE